MKIISHRGFWLLPEEKNTERAFIRSFKSGFGLETDLRDRNGMLVISHDPPLADCMTFDSFAELYKVHAFQVPLALNIKSDGLQALLEAALTRHEIENYFVFDMSIPDMLGYFNTKMNVFVRQSEIELQTSCFRKAQGVWMDCFCGEWMTVGEIKNHLEQGKQVCLVSPELHGRDHEGFWSMLKTADLYFYQELMLCTDFPQIAEEYFYG